MEYLKVWVDFREVLAPLSNEEKGRLFEAMLKYAEDGQEVELSGNERFLWAVARQHIDRTRAESERLKLNGAKGGRPKKQEEPKETSENQEKPKKTKFVPPTVEEVRAYCKERGNNVDPEHFVAYNENRNWTLSNGKKMKDWKLAVITWEKNNFSKPQAVQYEKKVNAQKYDQRDYHGAQETPEEMMERLLGGRNGK